MVEKYEVEKTSLLKGKYTFALNYQGQTDSGFAASFLIKLFNYGNNYELASDIFVSTDLYNAMLRAYCEGKKVLKQNKYDCEIANEAFALYQDKEQLKLKFDGQTS